MAERLTIDERLNQIKQVDPEIYKELTEYVNTIPLIRWMTLDARPRAKDKKRDEEGKIVVNITKPHILEDTDYFRQAAITYKTTGKYTEYYPSKVPSSPYKKFWDEEIRRCKYGYVRESDGEWITGYHYFYLNYSPILRTKVIGDVNEDGTIQAERIEDFPDFWDGDYLFYHYIDQAEKAGKYAAVLKARGKGYSFKAASALMRNYFLYKKSKSYAMASDSEYLLSDGVLSKTWDIFSFGVKNVGFSKKLTLKDTAMEKIAGYKKPGVAGDHGFLSSIHGVTLKNDPDKARGKRGKLILWEEAGSFPNILKSWRIAQKSLEDGQLVFGLMVAFGTGGEEGVDFAGLYELFYHPKVYQVYSVKNVWDKNSRGDCAFFVPDYWNRARTYDKDGNSDVLTAIVEVLRKRQTIRKESTNATDIARVKAEEPITPQEAVMRTTGTVFPVSDISEYLQDIEPNIEYFVQNHYVGDLNWTVDKQITFRPKFDVVPIRDFPYNERNTDGAIELFELPHVAPDETIPVRGRYIGGADTVDDDTGTSLFSVEIFDLFLDKPVAEYTGRMQRADQNFEIALKLAVYYNAEINYENKLKGMFAYFERNNALRYLADTPPILKDMEYIKQTHLIGNKSKGTPPTPAINAWGRRLQADWMMSKDAQGKLNLHKLRSIAYLKECLQWNIDGNFDRVSRSNMTHILRASRLKFIESVKKESISEVNPIDEDPFFKRNPYRGPGSLSGMFDSNLKVW
jgi:hypothetical protein